MTPFLSRQNLKLAEVQWRDDVQFPTVLLHAELLTQPHAVLLQCQNQIIYHWKFTIFNYPRSVRQCYLL